MSDRTWTSTDIYAAVARGELQGTKKERARIRRLIAPHIKRLSVYSAAMGDLGPASLSHLSAIIAATRPEPKRKKAKGTK